MADKTVLQLDTITSHSSGDYLLIARAGANKKILASDFLLQVTSGVRTFNGRSGYIVLQSTDLNGLNGAGLTGIAGATGGVINTGSTTIGADSDSNDIGVVVLQTRTKTRLQVNNDGVIFLPRNDHAHRIMKFESVDGGLDFNFGFYATVFDFGIVSRSAYWGINASTVDGPEVPGENAWAYSMEMNWQIDIDPTHIVDEAHLSHTFKDGVTHRPFTWYIQDWNKYAQLWFRAGEIQLQNTLGTTLWGKMSADVTFFDSPSFRLGGGDLLVTKSDDSHIFHVTAPAGLHAQIFIGNGDDGPSLSEGDASYAPTHAAAAGSIHMNPTGGGGQSGGTGSPTYVRDRLAGWGEVNGSYYRTATFNVGSIAAGRHLDYDTGLTPPAGFNLQDLVDARPDSSSGDVDDGIIPWAFISNAGTIVLRQFNGTASPIDPVNRKWNFRMSH